MGKAVSQETPDRSLTVPLESRSYPIRIGHGNLQDAGSEIARRTKATKAVIITVPEVGRRYAPKLARSLREAGIKSHRIEVPDGDSTKNLRQVEKLYNALLDVGADRSSVIVALGGGMVGDLAGFAAASYLRGIAFVQVPTTLLAMIDSSIGGKVGVNLTRGKNLVGAFHQPRLVWIDAATLRTLPARQRAAGFAEVAKAAALWDASFFDDLERDVEKVLDLEPEILLPTLERACGIKVEIVARDEREAGLRQLLNLGHTLGHAVEALSGYRKILHGEAVAIGMVYAARRSEQLELAPAGTAERIRDLLERAGLPTEPPSFPRADYLKALGIDKKRRDQHIQFVALRRIGKAETVPLTPAQILPAGALGRARKSGARGSARKRRR